MLPPDQNSERLDYLDSSRGIAAMIVLIYHTNEFIFHYVLDPSAHEWMLTSHTGYVLAIFINGTNAVSYFFVLSGFVLSYSFLKHSTQPGLAEFYVKRVFRILPLYIVVILLAVVMDYTHLPDSDLVLKELLLLPDVHLLVAPGWSLTVELLCSFFVPFLILLIQRKFNWFIALLLMIPFLFGYINTFLAHFMLGILLADMFRQGKISNEKASTQNRRTLKTAILIFVGFLLYALQPILRGFNNLVNEMEIVASFFRTNISAIYMLSSGIGSACFLYLLLRSQSAKSILQHRFLTFLGRISFGVYLVQWILIYYLLPHLTGLTLHHNTIGTYLAINLFIIAGTVTTATMLHYAIELPFIKIGKAIAIKTTARIATLAVIISEFNNK